MAQRIAAGDEAGAARVQTQAFTFTLLLAVPCMVAFLLVPDLIMRALFARGAFTAADAAAAGRTLAAYAIGLIPFVLVRSATATFLARGDTATPVKAALTAATVNILLKVLLMGSLAQVGLALATSIGAWINLGLVLWLAMRAGLLTGQPEFRRALLKLAAAGGVLAVALYIAEWPIAQSVGNWRFRDEAALAALAGIGLLVYGGMILTLFGPQWLRPLRRRS
jgi:putative peptidoglycan lipid II flippase